jgi:hypothetical protein
MVVRQHVRRDSPRAGTRLSLASDIFHSMEPKFPLYVGACVYCGSRELPLTDEHVIPYGLGGEWRLVDASCEKHRVITAAFEHQVLRGAFIVPRATLAMRTRRKRERPTHLPVTLGRAGQRSVVSVPIADHPAFFALPVFEPPGPASAAAESGIAIRTMVLASHTERAKRFRSTTDADTFSAPFPDLAAFARMLAKIAYCFAVGCLGYEALADAPVLAAILGHDLQLGRWVGSLEGEPRAGRTGVHEVQLFAEESVLQAHVRLLAHIGAPEYVVKLR